MTSQTHSGVLSRNLRTASASKTVRLLSVVVTKPATKSRPRWGYLLLGFVVFVVGFVLGKVGS